MAVSPRRRKARIKTIVRLIPEADVTSGTELFSAFQTFAGANERPSKLKERFCWEPALC
jgi:hypothetical protein